MRRARSRIAAIIAAVSVLAVCPLAPVKADGPPPSLTAGGFTWTPGEAEPVVGPHLPEDPIFSPDGDGLLAVQMHRPATVEALMDNAGNADTDCSLLYWNRLTHQTRVLWRYRCLPGEIIRFFDAEWFPDSTRLAAALLHIAKSDNAPVATHSDFLLINVLHGGVRSFPMPPGVVRTVSISPSGKRIALPVGPENSLGKSGDMLILDGDGQLVKSIPFQEDIFSTLAGGKWEDDDILHVQRLEVKQDKPIEWVPYTMDTRSGEITPRTAAPATPGTRGQDASGADALPLKLAQRTEAGGNGKPAATNIWLESIDPKSGPGGPPGSLLIAGDATSIRLVGSRDGTAGVIYQTHGSLMYMPLIRRKVDAPPPEAPSVR